MNAPPTHEELARLHAQGLTHGQIAKRYGLTRNQVLGRVHRATGRVSQTIAQREGLNIADPKRADKLLRRFSWQEAADAS